MTFLRVLVLLVFLAGAVTTLVAGGADSPVPSPSPEQKLAASAVDEPAACLSDAAAIADIRRQRDALQLREREIAAKESELKAREQAVSEELKKFDAIRKELTKAKGSRSAEEEERVSKLVETFETMSPKAASQLLASLDETLAVSTMSRISTQRLAKIMNVMEPAKASRLTELLAGVVRASKASPKEGGQENPSNGGSEATTNGKGGERT